MESMHKTRTLKDRQCTCWREHRLSLSNYAFKHLEAPGMKEALKAWIDDGDTHPAIGDHLYDLIWLEETNSKLETPKYAMNKYFVYDKLQSTSLVWKDVCLLKSVGKCDAYTYYDSAYLDGTRLEFVLCNSDSIVVRVPIVLY